MDLFISSTSKSERVAEIKELVMRALGLDSEASVLVTELQCREEGCPPLETVIAVFPVSGPKKQFKLHRPLAEITNDDIDRLCLESFAQSKEGKE